MFCISKKGQVVPRSSVHVHVRVDADSSPGVGTDEVGSWVAHGIWVAFVVSRTKTASGRLLLVVVVWEIPSPQWYRLRHFSPN